MAVGEVAQHPSGRDRRQFLVVAEEVARWPRVPARGRVPRRGRWSMPCRIRRRSAGCQPRWCRTMRGGIVVTGGRAAAVAGGRSCELDAFGDTVGRGGQVGAEHFGGGSGWGQPDHGAAAVAPRLPRLRPASAPAAPAPVPVPVLVPVTPPLFPLRPPSLCIRRRRSPFQPGGGIRGGSGWPPASGNHGGSGWFPGGGCGVRSGRFRWWRLWWQSGWLRW